MAEKHRLPRRITVLGEGNPAILELDVRFQGEDIIAVFGALMEARFKSCLGGNTLHFARFGADLRFNAWSSAACGLARPQNGSPVVRGEIARALFAAKPE
jgi:hypothetical protein